MPLIVTALTITAGIIAAMTASRVIDLTLPGNEAKLMKAMQKLKFKKGSAEEQFLKELTLDEVRAQAEHLRKTLEEDRTGTNMLAHSIASQPRSFRDKIGKPNEAIQASDRLRGNRQDVEGMHAALASLTEKTNPKQSGARIPAAIRLTGRPTRG